MQFQTSVGQFQIVEFIPNANGYYALFKDSEKEVYATKFPYWVVLNYYYASPDDAFLMTIPMPAKDFLAPTELIESFVGICGIVPQDIPIKDDLAFSYFFEQDANNAGAIAQLKTKFNLP